MEDNRINTLLFDLGNVVICFDHRRAVKRILPYTRKTPDEIYQLFFDSPYTGLFEEGKLDGREFFRWVKETLVLTIGYEEFLPIWNEIFFLTPDSLQVHQLVRRLKGVYTLIMISNINKLHFDYLQEKFAIFKDFAHLILSFQEGVRKPEKSIYQKALAYAQTKPQQVFYTDDRQDLIEAAQNLGFTSHVFKGAELLRKELSRLNILT